MRGYEIVGREPRVLRAYGATLGELFEEAAYAVFDQGYRLDEIDNAITQKTPSCFEPVLDYVVVKIPRFAFEKFPLADATLGVQMKAVGEVMAIGRTFSQAWLKGFRALENDRVGWVPAEDPADDRLPDDTGESRRSAIRTPTPERPFQL